MSKKKVLIVTQEMHPYTAISEIAEITRKLPQHAQENGMEVRVLMPRFGTINERRHRLHEVVRLSGMNIIVDDDDFPLIIKVASLPGARMQVYFLDNDDFFRRKSIFLDDQKKPYEDNPDRMVFFCKGVLETVKKFGWPPDIVHCHGWMTSLIPLYMKTAYKNEPLFQHAKVIYSVYPNTLEETFSDKFISKASINNLDEQDLEAYRNGGGITLHEGAIQFADAVVTNAEAHRPSIAEAIEKSDRPLLEANGMDDALPRYLEFYNQLLQEQVEG